MAREKRKATRNEDVSPHGKMARLASCDNTITSSQNKSTVKELARRAKMAREDPVKSANDRFRRATNEAWRRMKKAAMTSSEYLQLDDLGQATFLQSLERKFREERNQMRCVQYSLRGRLRGRPAWLYCVQTVDR